MSTLSRASVACLAVPHFFSRKRQGININVPRSSCNVSLFFQSEPNIGADLSKNTQYSFTKIHTVAAGLFPAGKQKDGQHMAKLIVAPGSVLQMHSVLDHVITDQPRGLVVRASGY
jgi:hypothetical protein